MADCISRSAAIKAARRHEVELPLYAPKETDIFWNDAIDIICDELESLPSAEPETIRCKDCKYWVRQTYQGVPLSWGNCESEHMWDSLYCETYEVAYINTNEEHFCGYAERISE